VRPAIFGITPPSASAGGQGMAPGFSGQMQMNVVILDMQAGEEQFQEMIGGVASNITMISAGISSGGLQSTPPRPSDGTQILPNLATASLMDLYFSMNGSILCSVLSNS